MIGWRKSSLLRQPITLLNSCFRFASREQIRLVENGLNKFKYCGNGTKGKWQGNDLDKGDHQFVMRVKDPPGNTKNLIDHKFVVGK